MRKRIIFSLLLGLLVLLLACAPKAEPVPSVPPTSQAPVAVSPAMSAVPVKQTWQDEWERLVNAAQREGKVVVYSGVGGEIRLVLADSFKKNYGINLEWIPAREHGAKMLAEHRAGLYLVDIEVGGSSTTLNQLKPAGILEPLEPVLLLPELTDPAEIKKVWHGGKLNWLEPDKQVLTFIKQVNTPITFNTNMVKSEDIKSYRNLLELRWKGKILMDDPTQVGSGQKWFGALGEKLMGWEFLREFAKQEPIVMRDRRLQVEWIAHGKYPLGIACKSDTVAEFMKAGAPFAQHIPVEGAYTTSGGGNVALIKNAPHPKAARLFINWLLTKEAQLLFSQAYGNPSVRMDVPISHLDPLTVPNPAVSYFDADNEDFALRLPEHQKLAREILGQLIK